MSAVNFQVFVWNNGEVVNNTKNMTPLYTGVGVSNNGSDNGYTITQDATSGFNFNSQKLVAITGGAASGQALTWDQIGESNLIAPLDSAGKVPLANMPLGTVEYQGTWNAATNTPSLANGTGTSGYYYRVNDAETNVDLGTTYAAAPATTDGTTATITVTETEHGLTTGMLITVATVATIGGITGANLSQTATPITVVDANTFTYQAGSASSSADSGTLDTIDVLQTFVVGDWIIYNGTVWQLAHAGSDLVASVNGFTGTVVLTTSSITEGTNLYFTNARVLAATLTGFTPGAGTVTSADSVLSALEKFEYRVALDDAKVSYSGSQAQSDLEGGGTYAIVTQTIASGDTQFAPSADAVYTALQGLSTPYQAFTNDDASTMNARDVGFVNPAATSHVLRADTTLSTMNAGTLFVMAVANVATSASGNFYMPDRGAIVTGFSGLTPNAPIYLSTAGGFTQTAPSAVGDSVVYLGTVLTATSIIWEPEFLFLVGS